MIRWQDIDPADAMDIDLTVRTDITAPLNENGERCPWPWDPQQLVGVPMGQYHCGHCGAMVLAGVPHLDYSDDESILTDFDGEGDEGVSRMAPGQTVMKFSADEMRVLQAAARFASEALYRQQTPASAADLATLKAVLVRLDEAGK